MALCPSRQLRAECHISLKLHKTHYEKQTILFCSPPFLIKCYLNPTRLSPSIAERNLSLSGDISLQKWRYASLSANIAADCFVTWSP